MSIANKINIEVTAWGMLAIVIVIVSLILLKFKSANVGNMTCIGGYTFNVTANDCYNSTGGKLAIEGTATTVDTFVTALSEPKNWVGIVIIAIIGFSLLYLFRKGKK